MLSFELRFGGSIELHEGMPGGERAEDISGWMMVGILHHC